MSVPEFERLLPRFLDLPLTLPSARVEVRSGRRVRAEFGDFAGHVPYTMGEDLRFLDWNALARTGHRVLRRFDETEHRRLTLLVDTSASMRVRLPVLTRLLEIWVFLGLYHLDSVELVLVGEQVDVHVLEGPDAWPYARECIGDIRFAGSRGLAAIGDFLAAHQRREGVLLVSDLQPEERAGAALSMGGGRGMVCLFPRVAVETGRLDAGSRQVSMRDAETGRALRARLTPALLHAFVDEQRQWEQRMSLLCREVGHAFVAATLPDTRVMLSVEAWLPFLEQQ